MWCTLSLAKITPIFLKIVWIIWYGINRGMSGDRHSVRPTQTHRDGRGPSARSADL